MSGVSSDIAHRENISGEAVQGTPARQTSKGKLKPQTPMRAAFVGFFTYPIISVLAATTLSAEESRLFSVSFLKSRGVIPRMHPTVTPRTAPMILVAVRGRVVDEVDILSAVTHSSYRRAIPLGDRLRRARLPPWL